MAQIVSLAWKEWHEVRWFLIVALGLFVGMPILGSLEGKLFFHMSHFFFDAAPWVVTLGGVMAVMVAVGIVCSDLGGRLEDFVRSRPLNLTRWMLVKYFVGLIATLAACVLPLAVDLAINTFSEYRTHIAITWYPFFWIALYTLAFLCALLVRRTAHAMMLALAAMLLMYFLPVVLPFLQYMSIDWVLDRSHVLEYRDKSFTLPWGAHVEPRQFWFVASMLAISAVALALSILAIRRNWRIESGTKMMYWSVGSSLLILFTSASLRLATNLPIESQADLPPTQFVSSIHLEGSRGILLLSNRDEQQVGNDLRTFELSGLQLHLGPVVTLPRDDPRLSADEIVWSEKNPDVLYLSDYEKKHDYPRAYILRTISISSAKKVAPPIVLWERKSVNDGWQRPRLHIFGDRLYCISDQLAVLDINEPAKPQLLSVARVRYQEYSKEAVGPGGVWIPLPQIPGLSARQRLQIRGYPEYRVIDGDLLCMAQGGGIWTYKLDQLDDKQAHFTPIGHYEPTLLEHVFGDSSGALVVRGNRAYLNQWNRLPGSSYRLTVFDIADPQRPHPIAHFATSSYPVRVSPLADGRSIVSAGNKLYLLGPPPVKE